VADVISNFLMCINQVKRNIVNEKRVYDELKKTANQFPKYRKKFYYEILM
jgi:hypothetical protein